MRFGLRKQCQLSGTHQVHVDNENPALAFAAQDPTDPELLRCSRWTTSFRDSKLARSYFRPSGTPDWYPLFTQKLEGELTGASRLDSWDTWDL